ncbi:MAG: peptidase M14 [Gammaproteobacteria bacterium]|nr:peptidase M14 [Gammaproteobacteria bacterium]
MTEKLAILSALPDGFHDFETNQILEYFPTTTLIEIEGNRSPPLFVSILLHGNEYSGLKAVQALLRKYRNGIPRSLYLLLGNVSAAAQGKRVLAGQVDYNRCWPGTEMNANAETRLMQTVVERVAQGPLFAAIDVHNTSGVNPHYAGLTMVTQENQHLAAMFNHICQVFTRPKGVMTMAFNELCPAAILECGRPGDVAGIQHATELLDALLHMDHFPQRPVAAHDLQMVRTVATLNIPDSVSLDFNLNSQTDLRFDQNFDRMNFTEIKPQDVFAYSSVETPLIATDQQGKDVTGQIIRVEGGKVYLNSTFMPAMITLDESIIRQDCLCHLLVDYDPATGS